MKARLVWQRRRKEEAAAAAETVQEVGLELLDDERREHIVAKLVAFRMRYMCL